jgi:CheY-like chemotaxis protein
MDSADKKTVLIVEDDAVVVEIYRRKIQREGYAVSVAEDGLEAMKQLPLLKPDLVLLDLMMPKFNGTDVLKFIRAHKDLKTTKVIIFTNAYMTDMAQEASKAGADRSLLKSNSTPAQLVGVIRELLDSAPATPGSAPVHPPLQPPAGTSIPAKDNPEHTLEARSHQHFLENAAGIMGEIRGLFAEFVTTTEPRLQTLRLEYFHRKIHFLVGVANVAHHHQIAHLASALEALILELQDLPKHLTPSVIQTIRLALDCLESLLANARQLMDSPPLSPTTLLVVDDDVLCNRALVHALGRASLKSNSTTDPAAAVKLLQEQRYDLILLDYFMPGMDGIELYTKLRQMPGQAKTPVIFITSAADFRERAQHVLQSGDDIITKPIFPIELALKILTLLLKKQLEEPASPK